MKFVTKKPPIIQSTQKTIKRSITLHIAILFASLSAVIMSGLHNVPEGLNFNVDQSFQAFGMLVIGALVAIVVELFYRLSEGDTTRFNSYTGFIDPISTGLLIALLLPVTTPVYVLAIAVIVGTYAGKLIFGGYGYYIFNPVLVGVLLVSISFSGQLLVADTPLLLLKEAITTDATLQLNLMELLVGNYAEIAIGSTGIILLAILFIFLAAKKVIDLRLSGIFLVTVAIIALGVGVILYGATMGAVAYMIVNLVTGLTLFGAVFLVSEPVSTPTSRETKIIFAVVVAVLMMLMRTLSDYSEGLIFAVLFGNMITPFINRTVKRSTSRSLLYTTIGCVIAVVVVTVAIGFILQGQLGELYEVAAIGGMLS